MRSVNLGRWSRRVERYFNIKGGGGLMDVDPSVSINLPLLGGGVEDRFLEGWNLYQVFLGVTAVAAQFSRALIRNPPGSNVIIVIESLNFVGTAIFSDYLIENNQPNLANVLGSALYRLDARSAFGGPTAILSTDTNATKTPGAASVVMVRPVGEVIVTVDQEIPIAPNDGLWMVSDVVNQTLQVGVRWRERALEASELT